MRKKVRHIDPNNKLKSLPFDFSVSPDVYNIENWVFSEMQEKRITIIEKSLLNIYSYYYINFLQ